MTRFLIQDDPQVMKDALRRAKKYRKISKPVDSFTNELNEDNRRPIIQFLPREGNMLVPTDDLLKALRK